VRRLITALSEIYCQVPGETVLKFGLHSEKVRRTFFSGRGADITGERGKDGMRIGLSAARDVAETDPIRCQNAIKRFILKRFAV